MVQALESDPVPLCNVNCWKSNRPPLSHILNVRSQVKGLLFTSPRSAYAFINSFVTRNTGYPSPWILSETKKEGKKTEHATKEHLRLRANSNANSNFTTWSFITTNNLSPKRTMETQRSDVCTYANLLLPRWRPFRLSEPSFLPRVANNHTHKGVSVFWKRTTVDKAQNKTVHQQDTCTSVNYVFKSSRVFPFLTNFFL